MPRRYYQPRQTNDRVDVNLPAWMDSLSDVERREAVGRFAEDKMDWQKANLEYSTGRNIYTERERIEEIRAKARFDASTFEKRYTAQQKSEIARIRAGQQAAHNNPNFSEKELIAIDRGADLAIVGIKPMDLPKLSPYPEGKGPGDSYIDPVTGMLKTVKPDGDTWQGDFRKTPQGHSQLMKDKMQSQVLLEALKWASDSTAVVTGYDANGKANKWRGYNRQEIADKVKNVMDAMNPQPDNVRIEPRETQLQNVTRNSNLQNMNEGERAASTQNINKQLESANAILRDAVSHPEKMQDEEFARQARSARDFVRGQQ